MRALYIISVYIHILSAMVWVGDILFIVFGVVPILREKENSAIIFG